MRFAFFTVLCLLFSRDLPAQAPDTLIIGYNVVPPFVVEKGGELDGPSVWLWEQILESYPMTCIYRRMPLDSLLRGLSNGTVDVSLSPLTITSARSEVFDFSSPYYIAHSSILQKEYSAFQRSVDFLLSFFSVNFFRALGALAFVIFIFGLLVWVFERKRNAEEFGPGTRGLWQGFWWSAVTMTTVGYGDKSPKTPGGRIVALVWMFTAIIIISGFTASIASSLTVNRIDATTSGIQDFKKKTLGTITSSATDQWLRQNFFTNRKGYADLPELLDALNKNEIEAIAYDHPVLQNLANMDSLARYRVLNIKYDPQFYAIGMKRDLDPVLKYRINLALLNTTEKMDWEVLLAEHNLR